MSLIIDCPILFIYAYCLTIVTLIRLFFSFFGPILLVSLELKVDMLIVLCDMKPILCILYVDIDVLVKATVPSMRYHP